MINIKARARNVIGWCDDHVSAYGVLTARCDNIDTCLASDVLCDKQCKGHPPLSVSAYSPLNDTVCLEFRATPRVTIGNIPFFSFIGKHHPINSSVSIKAIDGYGNMVSGAPVEVYSAGEPCSTITTCQGQIEPNQYNALELKPGDVNVCLACNAYAPITAPLQVCFSNPGLQLSQFENSIIKVQGREMCGFCGMKSVTSVVVLERTNNCEPLLGVHCNQAIEEAKKLYARERAPKCCDEKETSSHDDDFWSDSEYSEPTKTLKDLKKYIEEVIVQFLQKHDVKTIGDCDDDLREQLYSWVMRCVKGYMKKYKMASLLIEKNIPPEAIKKVARTLISNGIADYVDNLQDSALGYDLGSNDDDWNAASDEWD